MPAQNPDGQLRPVDHHLCRQHLEVRHSLCQKYEEKVFVGLQEKERGDNVKLARLQVACWGPGLEQMVDWIDPLFHSMGCVLLDSLRQ